MFFDRLIQTLGRLFGMYGGRGLPEHGNLRPHGKCDHGLVSAAVW